MNKQFHANCIPEFTKTSIFQSLNGSIYGLPAHVSSIACQVNPGSSQEFAYDPYEVLDCAEQEALCLKQQG